MWVTSLPSSYLEPRTVTLGVSRDQTGGSLNILSLSFGDVTNLATESLNDRVTVGVREGRDIRAMKCPTEAVKVPLSLLAREL